MADHGGLMVAVRDYHQDMSTELMYTCDEGYNWQTFTFIDVRVCVYKFFLRVRVNILLTYIYA